MLRQYIFGQFKRPTGLCGQLAGKIMSSRSSNIERNIKTIETLDLSPNERVLEIGCGPGVALFEVLKLIKTGLVMGIDHSPVMLNQARDRNISSVASGNLSLITGDFEQYNFQDKLFDKIYSVNVVQFLDDMERAYQKIHSLLEPGGISVTTYMPRSKKPTREQAIFMANKIQLNMIAAGFKNIKIDELPFKPTLAVIVSGKK